MKGLSLICWTDLILVSRKSAVNLIQYLPVIEIETECSTVITAQDRHDCHGIVRCHVDPHTDRKATREEDYSFKKNVTSRSDLFQGNTEFNLRTCLLSLKYE